MIYIWVNLLENLMGHTDKNLWLKIKNGMINQVWHECK